MMFGAELSNTNRQHHLTVSNFTMNGIHVLAIFCDFEFVLNE